MRVRKLSEWKSLRRFTEGATPVSGDSSMVAFAPASVDPPPQKRQRTRTAHNKSSFYNAFRGAEALRPQKPDLGWVSASRRAFQFHSVLIFGAAASFCALCLCAGFFLAFRHF